MLRYGLIAALALNLLGCSDEGPARDSAVSQDVVQGKDMAADQPVVTPDKGQPDQPLTADKGIKPDTSAGTTLSATNHIKGWGKKWCFTSGCHSKPLKGHTQTKEQSCAACHGGNGACDPNGANSTKKNHTKGLTCISSGCHSTLHGYTQNADCVACHLANAGLQDCP